MRVLCCAAGGVGGGGVGGVGGRGWYGMMARHVRTLKDGGH